ncbi:MAG TPA: hypothetical protein VKK31_10990 [Thermoanaerobaculia bacterium]|nr:hypothetical protein [Thermoanaerobaculia bacterium]
MNTTFRHAGHDLALTFAGGTQPAAFIQKDVDPWDDDLDGKKPPPPRVVVAAGSILQLVPRDDGSLMVAFTQSEGAAESLNGDEAVYVLILRWPTRP